VANVSGRSWTVVIEVCLLFNFAVVFGFNLFPVPPRKAQFIGFMNRQNAAIMSLVFFFYHLALVDDTQ
jgi:hypothetical protein